MAGLWCLYAQFYRYIFLIYCSILHGGRKTTTTTTATHSKNHHSCNQVLSCFEHDRTVFKKWPLKICFHLFSSVYIMGKGGAIITCPIFVSIVLCQMGILSIIHHSRAYWAIVKGEQTLVRSLAIRKWFILVSIYRTHTHSSSLWQSEKLLRFMDTFRIRRPSVQQSWCVFTLQQMVIHRSRRWGGKWCGNQTVRMDSFPFPVTVARGWADRADGRLLRVEATLSHHSEHPHTVIMRRDGNKSRA